MPHKEKREERKTKDLYQCPETTCPSYGACPHSEPHGAVVSSYKDDRNVYRSRNICKETCTIKSDALPCEKVDFPVAVGRGGQSPQREDNLHGFED